SVLFFFQAEDGIRDFHVTGVQTCALPILAARSSMTVAPAAVIELRAAIAARSNGSGRHRASSCHCCARLRASARAPPASRSRDKIGRASCRESVEEVAVVGG